MQNIGKTHRVLSTRHVFQRLAVHEVDIVDVRRVPGTILGRMYRINPIVRRGMRPVPVHLRMREDNYPLS